MAIVKVRTVCASVALAIAFAAAEPAPARAFSASVAASIEPEGYARIVFDFDVAPGASAKLVNGVLVVSFERPVSLDGGQWSKRLGDLVTAVRKDPDGTAIRLALRKPVRLNAMEAGDKFFVDLLPMNWVGMPPSLPDEVIAALSREAREGREIKAEENARRARPQPPLFISGATNPTFRRLVFSVADDVPVSFKRIGDRVAVKIGAPLRFDLPAVRAKLPPEFMSLDAERDASSLTIFAPASAGRDVRGFRDDGGYILDIDRDDASPAADAQQSADHAPARAEDAHAQDTSAGTGESHGDAGHGPTTLATAPAFKPSAAEDAGPRPGAEMTPGPSPVPAPVDLSKLAGSEPQSPPPTGEPSRVRSAPAGQTSPARATGPAIAPSISRVGDTLRLTFPFAKAPPAAVFLRGQTLWAVFDDASPLDLDRIVAGSGGVIVSADQIALDGGRAARLKLSEPWLVAAAQERSGWVISLGDGVVSRSEAIALTPVFGKEGHAALRAVAAGMGEIRMLRDPEVGDRLAVATLASPARGVSKPQSFVEFSALSTAQGLAFGLIADEVRVVGNVEGLTIERDTGLTISSDAVAPVAAGAMIPAGVTALDVASWKAEIERPFLVRERELIGAAAMSQTEARTEARLDLARFYQIRGLPAESLAVLEAIVADDTSVERDARVQIMRAAAEVELGHTQAALGILAKTALAGNPEAALWASVANADLNRPGEARTAFRQGERVLGQQPAALQARFIESAIGLALDAGDVVAASSLFERLEVLPAVHGVGARDVLRARVAAANGRKEQAYVALGAIAGGAEPAAAAEAELRSLEYGLELKTLTAADAIPRLERLVTGWRGDKIEAEGLTRLTSLYAAAERWRDAFASLRVAIEAYPDSDGSRSLQTAMQDKFTSLFLNGGLDRLPKLDALALFYDFKELSPGGRRGDELVRRLADKLVEVDLLDQATELLDYQIDKRLSGAARAQVAARAALVNLMNGKPAAAIDVLRRTRQADLPQSLWRLRLGLEARALALTGRTDLALELAVGVDGDEGKRLVADILWSARRWDQAGEAIEALLGSAWRGAKPLDARQRTDVLRAAIALSLGGDGLGVDRLRQKFSAKMANGPDAMGFDVVTASLDARGDAFRELARSVASTSSFEGFLNEYRKRAAEEPSSEASSAASADGEAKPQRPDRA